VLSKPLVGQSCLFLSAASCSRLFLWNDFPTQLADVGKFDDDCRRCKDAFASDSQSVYTWFLLVFAGVVWSDMAMVLMEASRATALLFIPGHAIINLGLFNMIFAVITSGSGPRSQS